MSADWQKWGTILSGIMLILVLIQVLPILNIRIPTDLFHEDSYAIKTLIDPLSSDTLPILQVSPIYYVEVSADVPSAANYGDDVKFAIHMINKGKNSIIEPKLKAFVVDSVGNIRGVFPDSAQNISGTTIPIDKKLNLIFHPPPSDQKIIGIWKLYIYIFDERDKDLVSYGIYEFSFTEGNQFSSNLSILIPILIFELMFVSVFVYRRYQRTLKYAGFVNQGNINFEAVETNYEKLAQEFRELNERLAMQKLKNEKNKLQADFTVASSSDIPKEEKTNSEK